MFDPTHMPRLNRNMVYLSACLMVTGAGAAGNLRTAAQRIAVDAVSIEG
jgi:hypothetical protein